MSGVMKEHHSSPSVRFKGFGGAWEVKRMGKAFELRQERNSDCHEKEILSVVKDVGVILYSEKGNLGNRAKEDLTQYNIAKKGDIVLNSMNVIIGSVGVSHYDGCISPAYYALKPRAVTDSHFWGYWFWRPETQGLISSRACGMMEIRRKISTDDLLDLNVPTPLRDEQRKIGAYFQSLDGLIAGREKALEKLKELKKAMLIKMFPQRGAKVPEVRFKGFDGAWEEKRLGEIVIKRNEHGVAGSLPKVEYEDVLSFEGTLKNDVRQLHVTKQGIVFHPGDVLFGKLRPYLGNWVRPEFDGIAAGDWWVMKPTDVDSLFLYVLIQTSQFQAAANQSAGSKMPRADWGLVSEVEYSLPPTRDEQRRIGAYFQSLDALIAGRREEVEKMKQMKKAMLDRMFV